MIALFKLLALLPLAVLHGLGAFLGVMIYGASPSYRRHLRTNLSLALGQAPSLGLALRAAAAAGRGALEMAFIWLRPKSTVVAKVRTTGWEHVEAAWRDGKGIIFLTPHLGCFEITAQNYAASAPVTVLYRRARKAWVEELIAMGRRTERVSLAPADLSGVRRLIKALRQKQAVGLLPDQVPRGGEGIWTPWFGRPAYTMTLAARLTEMPDTVVLFTWGERLPWGAGYVMHVSLPQAPIQGTLEERTAAINRELEVLIRRCPEQYLWGYARYKIPADGPPPPC